tara:strand:- start:4664 stop:5095 length:432 start_codon:yes stop_codon:yes gene_type:complete
MAHFAKIDDDNLVINVLHVNNSDILDDHGEQELLGQQHLQTHNNWPANQWIQTSYHCNFRGNYAGIGYTWDPTNEIFWPKKLYASWVKDIDNAKWKSPIGDEPVLTTEQQSQNEAGTHNWFYQWNETVYQADNTQGWVLANNN